MSPYLVFVIETFGLLLVLFIWNLTSKNLHKRLDTLEKNAVRISDAAQAYAVANFGLGVMLTIIVVSMAHYFLKF